MMSVFYQEEPSNPPRKCKYLAASTIKQALSNCHSSRRKQSLSSPESEEPVDNFDEEEEVFVSAVISKYMESRSRRKHTTGTDSFSCPWALSSSAWELVVPPKDHSKNGEDKDDFFSVNSQLSRCSSAISYDAFVSVKTRFSRCSSLNKIDFQDLSKRSIFLEFCHCDGWPFGLSRKVLLPPLPKSPPDSWSWSKSGRMKQIHH